MCGSYVFVRVRVCKYMVVLINMVCHCHYSSLTVLCSSDCFAVVTAQVVSTFDEITQQVITAYIVAYKLSQKTGIAK